MRAALLTGGAMLAMALTPALAATVELAEPTERYGHAVLGDAVEWGALRLTGEDGRAVFTHTLPEDRVFEDIEARQVFLAGPGEAIVVVESHLGLGAQLAVYGHDSGTIWKVAATPFIGQRNRWLAPAAIADFDGDGANDIAYVETPHLTGILKIVTLRGNALVPVAEPGAGFSNHRIGEDFITSGTRDCGEGVELLLPDRAWSILMAVQVRDGELDARALPYPPDLSGIERASRCAD